MEFDEAENEWREDDGPLFAWLPPEDRLWRHPSEMRDAPTAPHRLVDTEATGTTATLVRPGVRVWTLALAAGLAGALFASGFFVATGMSDRRTTVMEKVTTPATTALAATSNQPGSSSPSGASRTSSPTVAVGDWPAIASTLAASIVAVRVGGDADDARTGSGVLYASDKKDSYVLTASNLVTGRSHVEVSFNDGTSQTARVVGTDAVTGIAVLATAGDDHTLPYLGTVSDVEVAEQVLAEGTRVANASSVVTGTISGLDETVTTASPGGVATMDGLVALSGVTVPATSDGGALVAPTGEIVGIDTDLTGAPSSPDIAYAVPIDVAEHVAGQLVAGTRPTHPWLGVTDVTDLTSAPAEQLGVSGGAQVGAVTAGSPAAVAGLRPDDVITAFDGRAVPTSGALVTLLSQCQPGQTTVLTVYRQSKRSVVKVTLADQPAG